MTLDAAAVAAPLVTSMRLPAALAAVLPLVLVLVSRAATLGRRVGLGLTVGYLAYVVVALGGDATALGVVQSAGADIKRG